MRLTHPDNASTPSLPELEGAQLYYFGDCAIVLEVVPEPESTIAAPQQAQLHIWQLQKNLSAQLQQSAEIKDIVIGNGNLTVIFDALLADVKALTQIIADIWQAVATGNCHECRAAVQTHELSIRYGGEFGPDLPTVAEYHKLTTGQLIELHCEPRYTVSFMGFLPGFAYLTGLSEQLFTPRHTKPRLNIPAHSVGIGGSQTGIYPLASPGGWQLIGRYVGTAPLFDINRQQACLFAPGDHIRFIPYHA